MGNITSNSQKPLYSVLVFIIIGALLGSKVVAPELKIHSYTGFLIGILIALAMSYIFLPEFRERIKKTGKKYKFFDRYKQYFTHPTNLPWVLGMLWFLVFLVFSSNIMGITSVSFHLDIVMFLIGLSGFQLLRLKEGVNQFGEKYHGFWVYFNGVLAILFGWGMLVFGLLAHYFKW